MIRKQHFPRFTGVVLCFHFRNSPAHEPFHPSCCVSSSFTLLSRTFTHSLSHSVSFSLSLSLSHPPIYLPSVGLRGTPWRLFLCRSLSPTHASVFFYFLALGPPFPLFAFPAAVQRRRSKIFFFAIRFSPKFFPALASRCAVTFARCRVCVLAFTRLCSVCVLVCALAYLRAYISPYFYSAEVAEYSPSLSTTSSVPLFGTVHELSLVKSRAATLTVRQPQRR